MRLVLITAFVAGCSGSNVPTTFDTIAGLDLSPAAPVRTASAGEPPARKAGGDDGAQLYAPDKPGIAEGVTGAIRKPGMGSTGSDYDVNFSNADIAAVAKAVLGDTLHASYVIDPRVQGAITVSTSRAVTKDELLKLLEAALQMNDASLVNDGTQYRIVPGASVKEGSPSGVFEPMANGARNPDGFGVSILPLRFVKAASIAPVIEGYVARGGTVRATTRGNLLIVRGGAQERDALIEIVQYFDVDSLRNQAAGIAPLKNSDPNTIIAQLKKVMVVEGEAEATGLLRFEPLERLNAVLILAPDTRQIQRTVTWISRLDQDSLGGTDYHVYRVQNAKANLLAAVLNQTFGSGDGGAGRQQGSADPVQQSGGQGGGEVRSDAPAGNDKAQSPRSGPGATGPGGDEGASVVSTGSDVRIAANNASNTLIIRAPVRTYRQILSILREIDKPATQVMINVMIAEVSLNDNLRYGVEAYLKGKGFGAVLSNGPMPVEPSGKGLNLILGSMGSPKVVLEALSAVTNVRIVSSPSVVALDNQLATIKVGDKIPISSQQVMSTQSSLAPIVNSIEYRDSGVILRVVPRVSETNLVSMDISQELSAVATQAGSGPSLTPTISQRTITSAIAVYSRQTVVLGGLISSQISGAKDSVPLVNQLPLIGDLLGRNETTKQRTELVVFITPEVMRDARDASRVSEEVRSRLRLLVGR